MNEKYDDMIEVLSRLLSVEVSSDLNDEKFYKLQQLISNEFKPLIEEGNYLYKSRILNELDLLVRRIKQFSILPFMIGKTVIGVMNGNNENSKDFYKNIIKIDLFSSKYNENKSIPSIIINSIEQQNIFKNKYNHFGKLIEQDIEIIFRDLLNKYKIDIRQFLSNLCININTGYSDIVFIDFPEHNLRHNSFVEDLIASCDMILINAKDFTQWKKDLDNLKNKKYKRNVYIFQDGIQDDIVKYMESKQYTSFKLDINIGDYNERDICELFNEHNIPTYNIDYCTYLQSLLLKLEVYYKKAVEKQNNIFTELNRDIVMWKEDDEQLESAREIRDNILSQQKSNEVFLTKHFNVRNKLLKAIHEIEKDFEESYSKLNNRNSFIAEKKDKYILNMWKEICIDLIDIGIYEEANKYIQLLKESGYDKLFLINLYLSEKQGNSYNLQDIDKLKQSNDKDLGIIKAKIRYRNELGITEFDAGKLSDLLDYKETVDEMYVYAQYKKTIDVSESIRYFKYAFENGNKDAGNELMQLLKNDNNKVIRRDLEYLARLLLPQANYELAKEYLLEERYKKARICFKVAGVLGHLGAVSELANIEFNMGNHLRAIPLYEYAISKGLKDNLINENLGIAYYATKNYIRAMEILKNINSANSSFLVGKMHDYGLGTTKNLEKAKEFYLKAKNKGHSEAASNFEKVSARIEYPKGKSIYSSGSDYSPKSYSSGSSPSSSGCFLTTATCQALGKEDNCEELIVFKKYRDEHLIHDSDGAQLLREYYTIAPVIVEKIEATGKSQEIYNYMWDSYIRVGYKYLLIEDYLMAKTTYIDMVKELVESYL